MAEAEEEKEGEGEKKEETKGGEVGEMEEELKELVIPTPIALTPPEHTKLLDRLKVMDEKVEFVAGEFAQKQGEKLGFAIGTLYGVVIGILMYIVLIVI